MNLAPRPAAPPSCSAVLSRCCSALLVWASVAPSPRRRRRPTAGSWRPTLRGAWRSSEQCCQRCSFSATAAPSPPSPRSRASSDSHSARTCLLFLLSWPPNLAQRAGTRILCTRAHRRSDAPPPLRRPHRRRLPPHRPTTVVPLPPTFQPASRIELLPDSTCVFQLSCRDILPSPRPQVVRRFQGRPGRLLRRSARRGGRVRRHRHVGGARIHRHRTLGSGHRRRRRGRRQFRQRHGPRRAGRAGRRWGGGRGAATGAGTGLRARRHAAARVLAGGLLQPHGEESGQGGGA
mmetsp:Transcript_34528/g.111449  ORF Transcript_34528/g.111449 Transcript_34528/m.111449 type:complete len:291 (-) Transcript_34528:242-1114(-)